MNRLKHCHSAVLKRVCGSAAADVLNKLFDLALHDPHYLRFGYRPDCLLHGAEPVPSPPQPPAVHRDEGPVVSYSPDSHISAARSDRVLATPPATGDRKDGVRHPGDGRSSAFKHQRGSFVVLLLTAAAVRLR